MEKLADGLGTAIDIGAAEGEFTVFFLKTAHAKKVLAFEPNPENRENFLTNLKLNGLADDDRLKVIKKYLGQKEDDEWTSLDSFVEELREPVLVKMDVDGGEVEVLLGAKKLLRMPGIRFLIETHSAELEAQCIRILNDSGFTTQIIYNAWWRYFVKDQRPIAHNRWLVGYRSTDQTH